MSCEITQAYVDSYVDGELDLVRSLEIERHLEECTACSQVYQNRRALRAAITAAPLYYKAPASVRRQVQSSVRQASRAHRPPRVMPWRWLGAAASLAALVLISWTVVRLQLAPSTGDALAQEVLSSHVRSLMVGHLADVASTDQHTVKPWFDGKLDFSPPVEDFAGQGFPLVGGRLDYLDNRPVAALIYRRQQHIINLFVWPAAGDSETGLTLVTNQGYHEFHWTQSGMTFWSVSDLNTTELHQFIRLVQGESGGDSPSIRP